MSYQTLPVRRLIRILPIIGLLIAGIAPAALGQSGTPRQERPTLLVDDAATANPNLVDIQVADPAGFGVSGQTLQAPPGYTASVVAAGLGGPRFMAFDGAGNLIVGAADDGVVYRFPFADGQLGEGDVLVEELNQPTSVALYTAEDG